MKMVTKGTDKLYSNYLSNANSRWEYGNSVLYRMCKEQPEHKDIDVIVGKIWLIGRSYAAAIERRKMQSVAAMTFIMMWWLRNYWRSDRSLMIGLLV